MPYHLVDVELTEPLPTLTPAATERGLGVLVRLQGRPVAFLLEPWPPGRPVPADDLDRMIGRAGAAGVVGAAVGAELAAGGARAADQAGTGPALTVAVCTKDRADRLADCLDSLDASAAEASLAGASVAGAPAPPVELLVVDNAPSDDATRRLVATHPGVRYVVEPAAGLDFARNRAVGEATGDVLAFVDDDVVVDTGFVAGLHRAWADNPDAGCVTGLVLPYELVTEAQVRFEQRGGFRRGFEKLRYQGDRLEGNPLYPFGAGMFGAGCNMSFRRSLLAELGGFDEALDTGPPLPGGGDIDMFFRVVRAGWPLAYEPGVVVRHKHRREHEVLRRQYWSWGTGFMAFLAKWYPQVTAEDRRTIRRLLRWWFLRYQPGMLARGVLGRKGMTVDLALAELAGGVVGLAGEYRRSQRRVARSARSAGGPHAGGPQPNVVKVPAPERRKPHNIAGGAWRVVHVDLAAGPLPPPPDGPALVTFWWRDLPLGQVGPADDAFRPGPAGDGQAAAHRRWEQAVAGAVGPAVAARLSPGAVPRELPGLRREPGPDSQLAAAVAGGRALRALDVLPVVAVTGGPDGGGRHAVDASAVSVVVCTRGRPDTLARTLAALAAQRSAPGEVVVVENGPAGGATAAAVRRFPGARYVHEPRGGLSVARNAGVRHARGEVLAFTDDDAEPHPAWVGQLARAFAADPDLLAVTGLVLPAELDSEAARLFEFRMGGFSQGTVPLDYDRDWFRRSGRRGTAVWKVGAGANMAFRREAFALVGGFDERLGAGAAGCSEDSELWYRLVARGRTCRYEPAAVVSHYHRSELDGLRAQATAYLEGLVAALFVEFGRYRRPGELVRALVSLPAHLGDRAARARFGRSGRGDRLIGPELRGYGRGLRHAGLALRPEPPPIVTPPAEATPGEGTAPAYGRRAGRRAFLAANPFPHPLTEGFFFREKMRAIHRVTPDLAAGRVLEVGGGGSTLTALLFPGADVVNVDLDAGYGRGPAAQASGTRFVQADAVRLPFPDGAFDVVTFFDVLEHVPDDAAALAEARRVLRAGGTLLASAPNERWRFPYHRPLRRVCPTDAEVMAEWGHVRRGYRLDELDRLVGAPHARAATFITPLTVLAHDLSFSRLPGRVRRAAVAALAPATWLAHAAHRPGGPGTETAASWVVAPDVRA